MADILLSYERTDRQRVAPIVALLEAHGWSVQWEPAGEDQATETAAGCIIAAWSIDFVESDAVWAVAGDGLARGILVSVSIDFSRVPRELEPAPSLALAGWTGDASSARAQELLAVVGDLLAKAAAQPPRPSVPPAAGVVDVDSHPAPAQATELAAHQVPAIYPQSGAQAEPEAEAEIAFDTEPEVEFQVEPEVAFASTAAMPVLLREEGAVEPVWAFPEEPEEEARASRLPPVLLRDRGQQSIAPPTLPDAPATSFARRGLAAVLVIGLAAVGAAGVLWLMPGGSTPGREVAAVETAPLPAPKPDATPTAPAPPQEAKPQETEVQKITPHAAKPQDLKPQDAKPRDAKPQEAKAKPRRPSRKRCSRHRRLCPKTWRSRTSLGRSHRAWRSFSQVRDVSFASATFEPHARCWRRPRPLTLARSRSC